jgi:hypothetical protein
MEKREKQNRFLVAAKPYFDAIEQLMETEKKLRDDYEKSGDTVKLFTLADTALSNFSNYIVINKISLSILTIKNIDIIEEARRSLVRSLNFIEEGVTNKVNAPFCEYKEKMTRFDAIGSAARLFFLRKLGLSIALLEQAHGESSKIKWTFVDLEGRFAAVAKNLFDLAKAKELLSLTSPERDSAIEHVDLVKEQLDHAASRFRERYDATGNRPADISSALNFLYALRYFGRMCGYPSDEERLSKQINSWEKQLDGIVQTASSEKDAASLQTGSVA